MYERIKRLYEEGKLDNAGVYRAYENNLITLEEYREITGDMRNVEDTKNG